MKTIKFSASSVEAIKQTLQEKIDSFPDTTKGIINHGLIARP